ncbi:MAG: pyridoxal phosphate-dependent decarboxylase family protein, partial [Schleiferiaceae bacterium]
MKNWTQLYDLQLNDLDLDNQDREILQLLAEKLQDNYPYDRKEYAGQMIKPAHPLAQAAVWMTSFINPNNHALDGGKATSALELEVIDALATMVGYSSHLGHLTSGGTIANLEALWVARQSHPKTVVLANELAHYTHSRMSEVLGIPFEALPADAQGKICLDTLQERLVHYQNLGIKPTLVATMGTTGMGRVDPLDRIVALRGELDFRIHADAAYGGYFKLSALDGEARLAFDALSQADSIVIDPHKHGLQPYGCGAVLFNTPEVGQFYKHDSPYTYFTSSQLHLGEITLECSRAGASAAGVWA